MIELNKHRADLIKKGFAITNPIFNDDELNKLIDLVKNYSNEFAIRQLVNRIPRIYDVIFDNLIFKNLFDSICTNDYFLTKAIFFNKPSGSNWFVSYHQDLSISVTRKKEISGYTSWTKKNDQFGVIPPLEILQKTYTFRIHLDNADGSNGALRVIPCSHKNGLISKDFDKRSFDKEVLCEVKKGGIMLMKPLLLHASKKSTSNSNRRVIHLEFCNKQIPMEWLERRKVS